MLIQLSSGQGPSECELAVKLLADSLQKEFMDLSKSIPPTSQTKKLVCGH